MTPLLMAEELACRRGGRVLFSGLSFSVGPGEALLVVGPNGCGKTSLLRLLAGLGSPHAGTIQHGATVAWLGHDNALKPVLTVRQNLIFWADCASSPADPQAALEAVDLQALADVPARILSAGQKRRAAIARLFVSQADLWLLDEPTVGLDSRSVAMLARRMEEHCAKGGAIVAATHIPLGLAQASTLDLAA